MSAHLPLRDRHGSVRAHAVVDAADYEWASRWRWWLTNWGYAKRDERIGGRRRAILLHRELLGLAPGDGLEGDHINGDRLDNRRSNLRVVTRAGNQQNRHYGFGASSYRGVSWHKPSGRWRAGAQLGGKQRHLGLFILEEDAAAAAAAFRAEHMPYSTT